jgi:hypothetical protein
MFNSHTQLSCLLIAIGLFFVPESPRWLISKNRPEAAHHALERIHKKNDDILIQDQVDEMVNAREAEKASSGGESRWADVFRGTQRRRFLCAFGILVCQQSEWVLRTGVDCVLIGGWVVSFWGAVYFFVCHCFLRVNWVSLGVD